MTWPTTSGWVKLAWPPPNATKSVQVADANKEQAIGVRTAERDKAIQVADLEKEQAVGEKAAAFERESQVKDAEREMRVRVADADATAIEGENLAQAKVAASQAELAVKRAEAYQMGESRKTRSGSGRAGSAEPSDGQSRPGRSRTRGSRKASRTGSSGQGRKGTHHRGSRSRSRTQTDRRHG